MLIATRSSRTSIVAGSQCDYEGNMAEVDGIHQVLRSASNQVLGEYGNALVTGAATASGLTYQNHFVLKMQPFYPSKICAL